MRHVARTAFYPVIPRRFAALPLLGCLLGAVGCNTGVGGTETDTDGPDEDALDPLSCPDLTELIAACNYKHTFEENTNLSCPVGSGYASEVPSVPDVFAPTEECVALLLEYWTWEDDWFAEAADIAAAYEGKYEEPLDPADALAEEQKREEHLRRAVTGLHAMLFHPLLVGPEPTLLVDPLEVPEDWITDFGVAEKPAVALVLDESYYNAGFLHSFYHKVRQIWYYDPFDDYTDEHNHGWRMRFSHENVPASPDAPYGTTPVIEVKQDFIHAPYGGSEAGEKYVVAATFAHELGHAMTGIHHSVKSIGGVDTEYDEHFVSGQGYAPYALEAMFSNAMLIGAAFSRMPGKLAYLTDYLGESPAGLYSDACDDIFRYVEDIGTLYTNCSSLYLFDLLATRGPDPATATEDPCDSVLFACPAELEVGPPVSGHVAVTVPTWVFNYVSLQFDGFVMDAAASTTSITPPTGGSMAGFSIDWIHPDSLIAQFGIETGDVVVMIDGVAASNLAAVQRGIDKLTDLGAVSIVVWRDSQFVTLDYTVTD